MTKQERDAWALAYRLYDEFAPVLRDAAVNDNTDNMCSLFNAVVARIDQTYKESNDAGRMILVWAYGILEKVYDDARGMSRVSPGSKVTHREGETPGSGGSSLCRITRQKG